MIYGFVANPQMRKIVDAWANTLRNRMNRVGFSYLEEDIFSARFKDHIYVLANPFIPGRSITVNGVQTKRRNLMYLYPDPYREDGYLSIVLGNHFHSDKKPVLLPVICPWLCIRLASDGTVVDDGVVRFDAPRTGQQQKTEFTLSGFSLFNAYNPELIE